ncbi:hypothetical protein EON67_04200 [archaeon]|nr:MAG: hypothetical protein EON67_04200 [archaeon]
MRADLDLITRQDFLDYLKRDSEENGTTIVYATHIFDGLDDWATHYAHLGDKRILRTGKLLEDADFTGARTRGDPAPLLRTVERWFRSHRDMRLKRGEVVVEAAERAVDELRGELGNGYLPGRFNQGFN